MILETSTKDENQTKHNEVPSSNNINTNFLEKIKKFESFGDSQTKITSYQNSVDRPHKSNEVSNKFNKDPILKKTLITNKFDRSTFDSPESFFADNKQKPENLYENLTHFKPLYTSEQFTLKEKAHDANNVRPKTCNKWIKALKTKFSNNKSDYNNWVLDKSWVFSED